MAKSKSETFEFKTEVKQLLDLVIHSLYSHKDIFLRELISNASDAIDRLRFQGLTQPDLIPQDHEFQIKIHRDKEKKTLTISDSGIGMDHDELIENLGTIAKSGTKGFLEQVKAAKEKQQLELIGQFGVGFYSAFMVADKITVVTRKAGQEKAHIWSSEGEEGFQIKVTDRASVGSDIILSLKEDSMNYLEEHEIREVVRKYSDFVEHPIMMDIERQEKPRDKDGKEIEGSKATTVITEEVLNTKKAIWTRARKDVTPEEYHEFYKHLTHDYADPLDIIHYKAEGTIEFKALLFLPAKAPFDLYMQEGRKGMQLYVKRIFIMDDYRSLLPEYLRFVKGVVDSSDLPLNVSREILQQDAQFDKIKKNLVGKVLSNLSQMQEKKPEEYMKFYREFGSVLKEGVHVDPERKDKIADLLMYQTTSSKDGEFRSLRQYVIDMASEQKEIYYLLAENIAEAKNSPHLEAARKKGFEVILMTDPVDDWVVGSLMEYDKKKLVAIDKGELDLGEDKKEKEAIKKEQEKHKPLLEEIKEILKEDIEDVRFSSRLTDSASCLVNSEYAMGKHMEQMFKAMGQAMPTQKRILELNPKHPIVSILAGMHSKDKAASEFKDYVSLIYDQALLAEGSKLKNPALFTKKIGELMVKAANA